MFYHERATTFSRCRNDEIDIVGFDLTATLRIPVDAFWHH